MIIFAGKYLGRITLDLNSVLGNWYRKHTEIKVFWFLFSSARSFIIEPIFWFFLRLRVGLPRLQPQLKTVFKRFPQFFEKSHRRNTRSLLIVNSCIYYGGFVIIDHYFCIYIIKSFFKNFRLFSNVYPRQWIGQAFKF